MPPPAPARATQPLTEGDAAPELRARWVSGAGPRTLAEAGDRPVVLLMFGTYDANARVWMAKLQELVRARGDAVAVIAISHDAPGDMVTADDIARFAEELGVTFTVLWDSTRAVAAAYLPERDPTAYLLSKGNIHKVYGGLQRDTMHALTRDLDGISGE